MKTAGVHSVSERVGRSRAIRRKAGRETGEGLVVGDSFGVTGRTADFDDWTTTSSSAVNVSAKGAGAANANRARRASFTIKVGRGGRGGRDSRRAIL